MGRFAPSGPMAGFLWGTGAESIAFLQPPTTEAGRAELRVPAHRLAGSGSPLPLGHLPCPDAQSLIHQVPAAAARSPLSGLEATSEPSEEPQWERVSMCFLNQKGGLSSARAAQANKQKPVNGKMGAAGRSHDNKMRTIISLVPARRRESL